jgi:rhodanese-related sulfurtransferase
LLLYNAFSMDPKAVFRSVGPRQGARRGCLACGEVEGGDLGRKTITEQIERGEVDYEMFCGRVEDLRLLDTKKRVSAREFAERMLIGGEGRGRKESSSSAAALVVDVRGEVEYDLGAKVSGGINIPIWTILRHGQMARGGGGEGRLRDLWLDLRSQCAGEDDRPIYFLCQRGNDPQIAAQKFWEAESSNRRTSRWIGDVVGGFDALQRQRRQQQQQQ